MENASKEAPVLTHIQELVAEEHRLFDKGSLDDAQSERLAQIQVELDQCWDLLRQRRALRETGHDAGEAKLRPPEVVEKYVG
ncbi:MAG TPA: DUF2630 family protein [Casimicrobiaceae bacterium]|jgi:hypothetical protein|nr:DUF2630 family protein [Casimicrobiaceae bacterium]